MTSNPFNPGIYYNHYSDWHNILVALHEDNPDLAWKMYMILAEYCYSGCEKLPDWDAMPRTERAILRPIFTGCKDKADRSCDARRSGWYSRHTAHDEDVEKVKEALEACPTATFRKLSEMTGFGVTKCSNICAEMGWKQESRRKKMQDAVLTAEARSVAAWAARSTGDYPGTLPKEEDSPF